MDGLLRSANAQAAKHKGKTIRCSSVQMALNVGHGSSNYLVLLDKLAVPFFLTLNSDILGIDMFLQMFFQHHLLMPTQERGGEERLHTLCRARSTFQVAKGKCWWHWGGCWWGCIKCCQTGDRRSTETQTFQCVNFNIYIFLGVGSSWLGWNVNPTFLALELGWSGFIHKNEIIDLNQKEKPFLGSWFAPRWSSKELQHNYYSWPSRDALSNLGKSDESL